MSGPKETDTPDTDECEVDDTNENSNLSVRRQIFDSEDTKLTSKPEDSQKDGIEELREPGMFRKFDQIDIINSEETSEKERKLVLDNKYRVDENYEKFSVPESDSEKVIQTDTRKIESISETESKFILDTKEINEEDLVELYASESNSERLIQTDDVSSPNTSTVKRKLDPEVKEQSPGCSKDLYSLESPNKVVKSTSTKSDVKTELSPKLQVSEHFDLNFNPRELDSKITDAASPNVDLIQKPGDIECDEMIKESSNPDIALDLSFHRQKLDSKIRDVESPNVDLIQKPQDVGCGEMNKESVIPSGAQKLDRNDDNKIMETEKELDLVKLYRIQKWLRGISTFDLKGKFVQPDSSSSSKSSSSKRKSEVKDSIPGCSKDDNTSLSPNKVLKTPEQDHLDPVSSKSKTTVTDGTSLYTCSTCFQLFLNQEALDDHRTSCNWYLEYAAVKTETKVDFEGANSLKGSLHLLAKRISSFESISKTREKSLGKKYSNLISPTAKKMETDNDLLQPFFKCPECGCLLSRTNLDFCYHHAVTCFFANTRVSNSEVMKSGDTLDSGENYSITNSENSLCSEFLYNMLNFYKTQFMRATIAISEVTDEYSSSEKNYYECPICSKLLANQSLRDHIKISHMKKTFSAKDAARELAADASKHDFVKGSVFKCKKCGEKFSSSEGVRLHIDTYKDGDCCPGSSQFLESFEQDATPESVERDCCSGSSQIPNPNEQNVTPESVDRDCGSGSSQIPNTIEQNVPSESANRDCCPGSSQISNPNEQNFGCESENRDSCQGFSQILKFIEQYSGLTHENLYPESSQSPDPVEENYGSKSTQESVNRSTCEKAECDYASNCVKETAFTCRFCLYACENLDDMVDHYSIHELLRVCYPQSVMAAESISNHVCPDCFKPFDDMEILIDHIDLVYQRPFTCPTCHEFLASETNYDYHFQIHTSDLIKTYRDSQQHSQIDLQVTNSTEDQDITKNTAKRRRRRSKKILDNQKSDKNPLLLQTYDNSHKVDEATRPNVTTNASCDQSTSRDDTIETDTDLEKIQCRSNESLSSHQFIQSPKVQERANVRYYEDNTKQEYRGASENSKKLEDHISVTGPLSLQNVYSPTNRNVATTNTPSDQKNLKNEKSKEPNDELQRNLQEHTFASSTFTQIHPPQTRKVLSTYVSCVQDDIIKKNYKTASKESTERNLETLISDTDSQSPQAVQSPHTRQIVSTDVSSDQEVAIGEESKQSERNLQESISVAASSIPHIAGFYEENVIKDHIEQTSKESVKNNEKLTSSPQTIHSPCTLQIASTNVSSDQEVVFKKESDKPEKNLQESISATASSSFPQIIELSNKQVIFTYASDQEDIITEDYKESNRESESNLEGYKSIASPPDRRCSTIKAIENYDADVSAGASSDDQEVVQIGACGSYRIRSKNTSDEQSPISSGENSYRCAKCNITFESASNFVAHNLMHSIFMCLKCNEQFRLKSVFLEHLVQHTGRKPFACFNCWRSFATNNEFKIHENFCPGRKQTEGNRRTN